MDFGRLRTAVLLGLCEIGEVELYIISAASGGGRPISADRNEPGGTTSPQFYELASR
jgi:hypothetical protein